MSTPDSHSPTIDTSKTLEEGGERGEEDTVVIMEEDGVETNDGKDTSTTEPGPVSTSSHFEEEEEGVHSEREEGEILDDDDNINEATDRPSATDRGPPPPQLVLVPSPSRIHGDEPPSQEGGVGTPIKSSSPSTGVTESPPPTSLPPTLTSQPHIHSEEESPAIAMETDPPPVSEVGGVSKQAPPLSDQESSDDSDEEAIDLEIVIEGEEDDDEDVVVMERTLTIKAPPTSGSVTMATTGSTPSGSQGRGEGGKRSKECAKVKQFFTTLQKFANNISHDVAEQVQELITALVNGLATVEEFHQEIQVVTNYPLKEFVIPFLKENLVYFQEELKDTKQILSNILGSAPQPGGPPTAPQHAEPELVIVPSTKPSAPPTSSSVITVAPPTSPLKASANLVSMSAPPATIHEPPSIPPTRIETIPNITAGNMASSRKRPRDLFVEGEEGRQVYPNKRIPKPIPTATLTPTSSHDQQQVAVEPHPSRVTPPTSSAPSSATLPTPHAHYSRPSPTVTAETTPLREVSPSLTVANHQRLLNLIKDDWNCLDLMMTTLEGMVSKTQRSLMTLKERIHLVSTLTSAHNMYKQFEQEQEPIIQQRIQQAVDEVKTKSSEDKQKVLMDASRQLREALKEANAQSNSKENCWNCGRKATETCSGCSKARYCGTYCQHKDWDRHVKHCSTTSSSSSNNSNVTNNSNTTGVIGGGVAISNRSGSRDHISITRHHSNRTTPLSHAHGHTPNHHMSTAHSLITVPTTNPRLVKPTRATPIVAPMTTPTTYITSGSELLVPLHPDPLVNGTLTGTSNGVAVVTINRSSGDLAGSGGLL